MGTVLYHAGVKSEIATSVKLFWNDRSTNARFVPAADGLLMTVMGGKRTFTYRLGPLDIPLQVVQILLTA